MTLYMNTGPLIGQSFVTRMSDHNQLRALHRYYKLHCSFPVMAKLLEVVGISSRASVFDQVNRL